MKILFSASASPTPSPTPSSTTSTSDIVDSFQEWEQSVFSEGLVGTLIFAAIVAVVTFIILKIIKKTLSKHLAGNMKIFYRLIYVFIIAIAVLSVLVTITPLKELGTTLLASSGIAGVVIGLAAQETLGNIFSGISISASKPYVVGEFIEILGVSPPIIGTVSDIGLRHTIILDASNQNIVIPNSVIDKYVIRTTHLHNEGNLPAYINNFLDVGIGYDSDMDLAMKIMSELVLAHENSIDVRTEEDKQNGMPPVTIRITDLGNYSINLRATVWTKNIKIGYGTLSDLRYSIKKEYDKHGIEIPFPYQNIIIKKDSE